METIQEQTQFIHPDIVLSQKEIGKGSFATVFLGKQISTGEPLAIKAVIKSSLNKKILDSLESEIKILKSVIHPHIVHLKDIVRSQEQIYLIMEYCALGDLSSFIKSPTTEKSCYGGLLLPVVSNFVTQLASAMEFLRVHSLIHRDIKPQNILLSPDAKNPKFPILKIADFGFARALPSTSMASTLCGSPLYMAPEILRGDQYDAKSDLWSLGTVLYECITAKPPFRAQNHIELLKKIDIGKGGNFPDDSLMEEKIDSQLKDLIQKLLKKNPVERISFEEFFLHPCVSLHSEKGEFLKESSPQPSIPTSQPSQPLMDPPFKGYQMNAELFQNSHMKSLFQKQSEAQNYVVVEHEQAFAQWVDPSAFSIQCVADFYCPCPWNLELRINPKQLAQNDIGFIGVYALWAFTLQSLIHEWKNELKSNSHVILQLIVFILEFYQCCMDFAKHYKAKKQLDQETKRLLFWIHEQMMACLLHAENLKSSMHQTGNENVYNWIYERLCIELQQPQSQQKYQKILLILESLLHAQTLVKEPFLKKSWTMKSFDDVALKQNIINCLKLAT